MASMQPAPTAPKKGRTYRSALRIDMTPLVDLGFLLITFFVFTSSLSTAAAMPLFMPKDGTCTNTPESATLTVLLHSNDDVYAYNGFWAEALAQQKVIRTNYSTASGIGAFIRQKQQSMAQKDDLMVLIKPGAESSYKNVVDMLDEAVINGVKRYALVEPDAAEVIYLTKH